MASFDEAIPPGKAGKVTAVVHTESYRGPVEKTVQVTSSDPAKGTFTLRVKANVVGSVQVLPRAYVGFPGPPLWEYTARLLIRQEPSEKGELKITDLSISVPWLTAKVSKLEKPEPEKGILPAALPGDWAIDLAVSEDAPKGATGQQLRFKTGLTRETEVTVPISVSLQQPMQAVPMSIAMDMPAGSHETNGEFAVMVRPGLGKEIVTATASPDLFGVTIKPDGDRRYKATVHWKGSGENPEKFGNVVLSVGGENLSVPVRVIEIPAEGSPNGAGGAPGATHAAATGQPGKVPGAAPATPGHSEATP